jgi:hypothetical protein
MFQKFQVLLKSDQSIFLLANIVFSASTYMVMLFIPYMLTLKPMAEFSSVYNALILLIGIFEFGIPISFLRFYQMYKITFFINTLLQLTILITIFFISFPPLGIILLEMFHLDQTVINTSIFFIALMAQVSYSFSRNILLVERKYIYNLILSFSIFFIRIISLGYLYIHELFTINSILFSMFIIPFTLVFYVIISDSLKNLLPTKILTFPCNYKIFIFRLKRYLKYSLSTFIIGVIYVFAGRYIIIYLTETHQLSLLADLGYSMTFLGVVAIATASFRTFFIAKFHLGDMNSIILHLDSYLKSVKLYVFYAFILSILLSLIIYLIMPSYLTYRTPIFSFITTFSYAIIFLMSLVNFLARTMNYNRLEASINIFRLVMVILISRFIFLNFPIFGFFLINMILVFGELLMTKIILKRLYNAH